MKMHRVIFLCCLVLTGACSKSNVENPTNEFLAGKKQANLNDTRLKELSGLAASIANPGFLWTHNDGENDAEVFLIDENLTVKMTCVLKGIKNRDWEDIATGPGPEEGKNYVYIGDIGDNDRKHQWKYIYRFEEPNLKAGKKITIANIDVIIFKLEDKRKDTETLLIDPQTKNLYVISKREKPVHVYELQYPHSTTDSLVAHSIAKLPLTQIVAGDFSADGKCVLLKNYEHVYYWKNTRNKSLPELLKEVPFEVPYEIEPQGESIAWAHDGSGFYTISEKNLFKETYLYFYKKK